MPTATPTKSRPSTSDLDRAIETFVRGFSFTRSFTHPYVPERLDQVWVLRDAPRTRKSDTYRNEEYVAHNVSPEDLDRIARANARGRYRLCPVRAVNEPDAPLRAAFKALHYRLQATEPLMLHRLKKIPRLSASASIERVTTPEMADRLAKAAGSRQVTHDLLTPDAPLRQYVALDNAHSPIGWVRSIVVDDATWVSNMYVLPSHRRRGIARAMLVRMLREDRARGAQLSVLTASHAGALLYPLVGYEQVGELLSYSPRKR